MKHIVMFSGGINSWAAARRVADRYGTDHLTLLFADTKIEDEDLYRFLEEAAVDVGGELVKIADGRTIWEVFHDERFLGNHRVDPCSKILKRELIDRWLADNCDPTDTLVAMGFDWSEGHRMDRMRKRDTVWNRWAPLLERPYITREQTMDMLRQQGVRVPRLYELGFQHNNCGGGCVKAGQAAWAHLLKTLPDRYKSWEDNEEEFRRFIGKDVGILTDRRGGTRKVMTLRQFRERVQQSEEYDTQDWGACGCFQIPMEME